jgi:serine/threonine-protein kinase HipA
LGLSVGMKYERAYGDGADVAHLREGVNFPKLFSLIDQSPLPAVDRLGLLRWAIFQVLLGNTDAHGKNVSFFCDERGLRLAPAYDLVCMKALDAGFGDNYAMAYGDAFSEHELTPYEWGHFAHQCKLPFRLVAHELDTLAGKVLAAIDPLVADMLQQDVPDNVAQRLKEVVVGICTRQRMHTRQIARAKRADYA